MEGFVWIMCVSDVVHASSRCYLFLLLSVFVHALQAGVHWRPYRGSLSVLILHFVRGFAVALSMTYHMESATTTVASPVAAPLPQAAGYGICVGLGAFLPAVRE